MQLVKKIKPGKLFPPFCVFIISLLAYIHNLSASVYGGDSGDFLSAIAVRGVPHPSGYPLYTLLGILASWLPIHQTLAWKVGLISALFASLTVVVVYKIVYELLENTLLATATSLTLAFVFPFWLFAEVSEVFALHSFFLLLLFYLGLLLYTRKRPTYLYLLSFFTGLSFANHELTLFMLPTLFIFIFTARKNITLTVKTIGKCLGLFILGLTPYLYIPIAALHNPPINWDHATTLENFIHLVSRADYGWGVNGGTNNTISLLSFQQYISYLVSSVSIFVIGCALFGVYYLLRKKDFTILFAILFSYMLFGPFFYLYYATVTLDNLTYGIYEKFYTASMLFMFLLVPNGIAYLANFISRMFASTLRDEKSVIKLKKIFLSLFLLIPLWLFFSNFSKTNLSTLHIGDMLGKDILTNLPKQSYVTTQGEDNFVFSSWYMQYANGVRQDVKILPKTDFLYLISHRNIPEQENTSYIGDKTKGGKLETTIPMRASIFTVVKDYNSLDSVSKTSLVPYGLLFRAEQKISEDNFLKIQQPILANLEKSTHIMQSTELLSQLKLVADIPLWYARAYANTGNYLILQFHDYNTAKLYFKKALDISPNADAAVEGLGDYSLSRNDCKKAQQFYERAVEINFVNKRVYQKLYDVVANCLHDNAKAQQLQQFFSSHKSFFGSM